MNEKEERIKKMIADGKISQEEGNKLFEALKESETKKPPIVNQIEESSSYKLVSVYFRNLALKIISIIFLIINVIVCVKLLIMRGGLVRSYEDMGVSLPWITQLVIVSPNLVFVPLVLSLVIGLIVKEYLIARKGITLIINIVAFFVVLVVFMTAVFAPIEAEVKQIRDRKEKASSAPVSSNKSIIDSNNWVLSLHEGKYYKAGGHEIQLKKVMIHKNRPSGFDTQLITESWLDYKEPTILISKDGTVSVSRTQLDFPQSVLNDITAQKITIGDYLRSVDTSGYDKPLKDFLGLK
jgi:hypothetical protein